MIHKFIISHQFFLFATIFCALAVWRDHSSKTITSHEWAALRWIPDCSLHINWLPHICPCVAVQSSSPDTYSALRKAKPWCSSNQRETLHALLPSTCLLSGSIMVSNVAFSSVVSRKQTAGLWGQPWINEDDGGIKAEMFQLLSRDNTAWESKDNMLPSFFIIVLLSNCCTGCWTDLWYNYTTKDKQEVYHGHT